MSHKLIVLSSLVLQTFHLSDQVPDDQKPEWAIRDKETSGGVKWWTKTPLNIDK